jgi:hypothetical protein
MVNLKKKIRKNMRIMKNGKFIIKFIKEYNIFFFN